jgi:hypothetical protein
VIFRSYVSLPEGNLHFKSTPLLGFPLQADGTSTPPSVPGAGRAARWLSVFWRLGFTKLVVLWWFYGSFVVVFYGIYSKWDFNGISMRP